MRLVHELGSSVNGRDVVGGRGADLARLAELELPVAPGFVIATAAWHLVRLRIHPAGIASMREQVSEALCALELRTGRRLDDPDDPLLLAAAASSATYEAVPEPVITGIGLSDATVGGLAVRTTALAAWQAYRNLVHAFCAHVVALELEAIDCTLAGADADPVRQVRVLQALLARHGHVWPDHARDQLELVVSAVLLGAAAPTAVVVQARAPGAVELPPATGMVYTRDPAIGAPRPVGDLDRLNSFAPAALERLLSVETIHRDMCEIQFEVEGGRLLVHDIRPGRRSGLAAIHIAVDMVDGGLIDPPTALRRIPLAALEDVARLVVARGHRLELVARGEVASPGVATGMLVRLDAESSPVADELAGRIVVTCDPDDVRWDRAGAAGVVFTRGSPADTGPALARLLRLPAISTHRELDLPDGAEVTLDATSGTLHLGTAPLSPPAPDAALGRVLGWLSDGSALPTRSTAPPNALVIDLPADLADAPATILSTQRARPHAAHWLRLRSPITGDLQPPPGRYTGVVAPPHLRWAGGLLAWRLSRAGRPSARAQRAADPGS